MCFTNCISPEYCPDDNLTYPCMECDYCNESNPDYVANANIYDDEQLQGHEEDGKWEQECNEFHYLLTSLETTFGVNNVKPLRKRHGKHNIQVVTDDLPF